MNYTQLTEHERYQIYSLKKAGHKPVEIARLLNRSISTICRELERNSGQRGYRPKQAHGFAVERRKKAKKFKKLTAEVIQWITRLVRQDLSPEQVVNYLKHHKDVTLHHETVYQLIYADKAQ